MKKRNKMYYVLPAVAVAALLAGETVSAFGGPTNWQSDPASVTKQWEGRIGQKASILGVSADEMKTYWSQGKNLRQIATEKGISHEEMQKRLQAAHHSKAKEWLQSMVTQGKITQAQADARLKFMQDNPRLEKGMTHGKMMRRMHGGEFKWLSFF